MHRICVRPRHRSLRLRNLILSILNILLNSRAAGTASLISGLADHATLVLDLLHASGYIGRCVTQDPHHLIEVLEKQVEFVDKWIRQAAQELVRLR